MPTSFYKTKTHFNAPSSKCRSPFPLLHFCSPMAESSDKIPPSKRRLTFLFRCFGSSPKVQSQKAPGNARRNRRTSSLFFRSKNSSATVPVDATVPEITFSCHDEASLLPEFKKPPPPTKSRAPAVRAEIIESTKPSQTPKKTESTQSDFTTERFPPAKRTAASLHSVSFPSRRLNRQKYLKKSVSHLAAAASASSDRPKQPTNSPAKKFDPMILIVAVAIVVLWGRLCAILCTTAMFYFGRRLRSKVEPDGGRGSGGGCGIEGVS